MAKPQSFESHARYVPQFHFVLGGVLVIHFVWRVVELFKAPSWDAGLNAVMGWAFIQMFLSMRGFPLKVQDRVIRMEELDRLRRLAPADFQDRIGDFTTEQLIGLRFASDAELPALARRVLDEKIEARNSIKGLITSWRPDEMRA
jgi:hypothetical protein